MTSWIYTLHYTAYLRLNLSLTSTSLSKCRGSSHLRTYSVAVLPEKIWELSLPVLLLNMHTFWGRKHVVVLNKYHVRGNRFRSNHWTWIPWSCLLSSVTCHTHYTPGFRDFISLSILLGIVPWLNPSSLYLGNWVLFEPLKLIRLYIYEISIFPFAYTRCLAWPRLTTVGVCMFSQCIYILY